VPVNAPLYFIKGQKSQKFMKVEKLSKDMTEIHAQMAEKASRYCKAAIQKHNDKCSAARINVVVVVMSTISVV
jgi:hypothetical protein